MSKINLFTAAQSSPANIAAPVVSDWKSEPISVKQIVAIARLFRSKDLLAITDPAIRALVANVAVFDDETGHWTELPKLTKGQGSDLIGALKSLPKVGFSPVAKGAAEPVTEAPKVAPKAKPVKQTKSAEIVAPVLGVHETADGLRFEVYKTAKGQTRTRLV